MPTKTKGGSGGYDPKNIKRNRNKRKVKASEEKGETQLSSSTNS
jgi:hypothetical protein